MGVKKFIRRNESCPCGSGNKYKRCCGALEKNQIKSDGVIKIIKRKQAENVQRRLLQGWGKPIVSSKVANKRVVAVGNRLYTGEWETFHDFLYEYIPALFGREWYDKEITSSDDFKHPLLSIYEKINKYRATLVKQNGYISAPFTGAIAVYMWLSYNLYLISHNAELLELLLSRLKDKDQFASAYYETFVSAICIKAGFEISFEDESDRGTTHCEFTATHKQTGKKYSVEAKLRNRINALSRSGSKDFKFDIGRSLSRALSKQAPHERIVFIDLNMPFEEAIKYESSELNRRIRMLEKDKIYLKDPKSAYLFVTNHSFHYDLDGESHHSIYFINQFNIPDFRFDNMRLDVAVSARKRHLPIYDLWESIGLHVALPETFDGSLPEFEQLEDGNTRLLYGEKYEIVDQNGVERVVTLLKAVVDVTAKNATGLCGDELGKVHMVVFTLSDNEIRAYQRSPDTFFGEYEKVSRQIKNPLDAFNFAMRGFHKLTKDELMIKLSKHGDQKTLLQKSREELLEIYCIDVAGEIFSLAEKDR